MALSQEKVVALLRQRGPSVPAELTSVLGDTTFVVGAFLSELVSSKRVRVTHAKIGGSPLYYILEHHPRITRLYEHLHEKERSAFDALKEHRILRDDKQTPLIRTCLRNLRDFAYPVTVTLGTEEFLFWRYFLVSQQEAEQLIQHQLAPAKKVEPAKRKESTPKSVEKSAEEQTEKPAEKPAEKLVEKPEKKVQKKEVSPPEPKQQALSAFSSEELASDALFEKFNHFCENRNITILSCKKVRANAELEATAIVPSAVGQLTFFVKVRKKKNCTEGDVSAAVLGANEKGFPLLFLATGTISKKVLSMKNGIFKNVTFIEEFA